MQNDLISRSQLMKKIAEEYDLNYGEILINPERFYEMVEDMPTAYDVKRVIEQIKEYERRTYGEIHPAVVVSIVKRGGRE